MKQNNINKKRNRFIKRIMATVLCAAILASVLPQTNAMAKSGKLKMTYNSNTVVLNSLGINSDEKEPRLFFAKYKTIKKAFGKPEFISPDGIGGSGNKDFYQYKEKGFLFSFYVEKGTSFIQGLDIKITSGKSALNGIKIGMSLKNVQKKLEKEYGKSYVKTSKNKGKIELSYLEYMPIQYKFEDGKVSKMKFFCS